MYMPNQALPDIQSSQDVRGVAIDRVGVSSLEMPFQVREKDGSTQPVAAKVWLSISLPSEVKGTHFSRFVIQLAEWSKRKVLGLDLRGFLLETMERLHAPAAQVCFRFQYFINKTAPVSKLSAPMGYHCELSAQVDTKKKSANEKTVVRTVLGVEVPISTLCPCSKAISEYGAHNQRALVRARLLLDNESDNLLWIEDVIRSLEECSSCPVYPILKREDEKYVTERQYENPMFVEDVSREVTLLLRNFPGVKGFAIEIEALESIHGHNAWTAHEESFS